MPTQDTAATSIAALITIIALLIIAYLVLIPPEDRAKLLGAEDSSQQGENRDQILTERGINLLNEAPGKVNPYKKDTITHSLTPIILYNKLDSASIKLANTLQITKNIFKEDKKTILLSLDENTESASLYFNIIKGKGELAISLNNQLIYEGKLTIDQLPIELPKTYFLENNVLEFKTTSPGWAFWGSNEYQLKDLTLLTKSRASNKKATRGIVISSTEKESIDKAELDYFISCVNDENGMMRVFLNNRLLFTDIILCDIKQNPIEIDLSLLEEGKNTIEFQIDSGEYRIEQIELKTELNEQSYPRYSFDIDQKLMDGLEGHSRKLELVMNFEEDKLRKRAIITINENQITLDTTAEDYTRDISAYVEEGENSIKIIPKTTFEIDLLRVNIR